MAIQRWTLIDQGKNEHAGDVTFRAEDRQGRVQDCSVTQRVLRCGLSAGVTAIRVDNGTFAFDVLPTRGMGIWKAWLDADEIGWKSPIRGPVHPSFVPLAEPSGLGWLDGFDELFVRCGLESNGAPEFDDRGHLKYAVHGRIANKPAHRVDLSIDDETGEITLRGEVEETRFHFLKLRLTTTITARPGESGFRVQDEVLNFSESPAEFQLLYHINFGQPILDGGARLVAPVTEVVPRNEHAAASVDQWDTYGAEQPGFAEQVYFLKLAADPQGRTAILLKNAHGTRGVSLDYEVKELPYFTVWKNTTGGADGYVTGLEPGTNFPNPRSYEGEQGRVRKLAPGESASFDLRLMVHRDAAAVVEGERAIGELIDRREAAPKIHREPQDGWCAP